MLGLARVEQLNLGLSAGAVATSYALETPEFAASLAAGAALEALNLGAIHRGARRLFEGELAGARAWVGVFSLRFVLLAVAIFASLQLGADPAALLIGLSLAMPATLIDAWIHRPPVVDPATLPVLLNEDPLADSDDADVVDAWENWSVWRPGRLLTTQRDDLHPERSALGEAATAPPSRAPARAPARAPGNSVAEADPLVPSTVGSEATIGSETRSALRLRPDERAQ